MRFALPLLTAGCLTMEVPIGSNLADPVVPPTPGIEDKDDDGFAESAGDCDDLVAQVGPGFYEGCDGLDNDCDGSIDTIGATNVCHVQVRVDQEMKTDVLVVIENSFAMQPMFPVAVEGLDAMARHLVGSGSQTRLGLITTDVVNPRHSGRLQAPSQAQGLWLNGDDPSLTAEGVHDWLDFVVSDTDVQMWGDSGARLAIEKAIALNDADNRGFFRSGVSLNVVILSTREDTLDPHNLEFLNDLAYFEGALSEVKIHAVTQTSAIGCDGRPTLPAASTVGLVQQTGGFYESVCMPDWMGFLSSVGQSIANEALKNTFALTAPAQLGTVSVSIIDTSGLETVWDGGFALTDPYTLVFLGVAPPAGSTIVVDYLEDHRF